MPAVFAALSASEAIEGTQTQPYGAYTSSLITSNCRTSSRALISGPCCPAHCCPKQGLADTRRLTSSCLECLSLLVGHVAATACNVAAHTGCRSSHVLLPGTAHCKPLVARGTPEDTCSAGRGVTVLLLSDLDATMFAREEPVSMACCWGAHGVDAWKAAEFG